MKKNKWILLIIFAIILIFTVVIFIYFPNNKKNKKDSDIDNQIKELYHERLFRIGYNIYEDDELVLEYSTIIDNRYIEFEKDIVLYCDLENDSCINYSYKFDKNMLYIESDDYLLKKGTYQISFQDENVEFILTEGNRKTIYYFTPAEG